MRALEEELGLKLLFRELGKRHAVYRRILPCFATDFVRLAVLSAFPGVALFPVRAFN